HGGGLAHADGGHRRLDVLHRVVDRQPRRHRAARAVDVDVHVLVGVLGFQEEELGDDQVGHVVFDVARQEDDALLEKAREDVERPLAAGRLLDDHRYQCHRTSYDSESIWAFSISRFRTLASRRLSRRWSRSPPRWSTPRTAWGGRPDSRAIRAISA